MDCKKLLFCTGEGIGNVIQTIPVIRTLKEVLGFEIDLWHAFSSFPVPKVIPYVNKWIVGGNIRNINFSEYVGAVTTTWTKTHVKQLPIRVLNDPVGSFSMTRSEVDVYMDIARDLGAEEESLIWEGECLYSNVSDEDKYDIVIHNGYNYKGADRWQVKSYPYYREVAEMLLDDGFKVCSVGSDQEYIKGTKNMTGLDLLTTLGVIKKSDVFLGNDSGLYHCANALRVPNVAIFTFTSTEKNYDRRFHKYAYIAGRDDLECRWCQCQPRFETCENHECREVDPEDIYESVLGLYWGRYLG